MKIINLLYNCIEVLSYNPTEILEMMRDLAKTTLYYDHIRCQKIWVLARWVPLSAIFLLHLLPQIKMLLVENIPEIYTN